MINDFDAPIPGQSLTSAPKSFAYENPPEFADPEDVLNVYREGLSNPGAVENFAKMMDLGLPVKDLTEGILRAGVAGGVHTIDASLLVAPAVHEMLIDIANAAGVDYIEQEEDPSVQEGKESYRKAKIAKAMEKAMSEKRAPEKDIDKTPEVEIIEEKPAEKPSIMRRRT